MIRARAAVEDPVGGLDRAGLQGLMLLETGQDRGEIGAGQVEELVEAVDDEIGSVVSYS